MSVPGREEPPGSRGLDRPGNTAWPSGRPTGTTELSVEAGARLAPAPGRPQVQTDAGLTSSPAF